MAQAVSEKLLLIGYGNTLRGDDGAGPLVVREVVERNHDMVKACVVQQLTPELCTTLAEHAAVIFVDASAASDTDGCRLLPVASTSGAAWDTHLSSPASLLALAEELYGRKPRAWCLAVPGQDFRLGEGLSTLSRDCAKEAVKIIEDFLQPYHKKGCRGA
jgi:hydrogenase maturation protease